MSNYNQNTNDTDKTGDIISWIIVIILMFVFPPAGWILLLIKLGFFAKRKSAVRKKRSKLDMKTGKGMSILLLLASIVFLLTGIGITAGALSGWALNSLFISVVELSWGGLCLLSAAICFFSRNIIPRRFSRYKKYYALSEGHGVVSIDRLAQIAGVSVKAAIRDIEAMIVSGYLDAGAYVDNELGYLVLSPEEGKKLRIGIMGSVFGNDDVNKGSEVESISGDNQKCVYTATLAELREVISFIGDDAISEKASRLEELTEKIFKIVDENPQKQPQLRRFSNYYLPTTLKLLRSYATLEKQGVKGENIMSAKKNISDILDTLVTGFEQQLDLLFKSDAIDIAADINVLENLMQQDGLKSDNSEFQVTASGS
ncbi:MAG: 5-bromo-4-chloroindolyl phosphate hydrolysis family protein [Oscillospiraceae bacterium]|nr:5-bromo-4-chloroindolyl phosphate hydrolysis family protein [Oscillospiraceae bacterium]